MHILFEPLNQNGSDMYSPQQLAPFISRAVVSMMACIRESTGSHRPPSEMLAALPTHVILMGINGR
jgi:hypothetical protein